MAWKHTAAAGHAAAFLVALMVLRPPRMTAYSAPIAWRLFAVCVADEGAKPAVASPAKGSILVAASIWQGRPTV